MDCLHCQQAQWLPSSVQPVTACALSFWGSQPLTASDLEAQEHIVILWIRSVWSGLISSMRAVLEIGRTVLRYNLYDTC